MSYSPGHQDEDASYSPARQDEDTSYSPARQGGDASETSRTEHWLIRKTDGAPLAFAKLKTHDPRAGEMAEWLKAHAWKACLGETLTWVRIPLSPPFLPIF